MTLVYQHSTAPLELICHGPIVPIVHVIRVFSKAALCVDIACSGTVAGQKLTMVHAHRSKEKSHSAKLGLQLCSHSACVFR